MRIESSTVCSMADSAAYPHHSRARTKGHAPRKCYLAVASAVWQQALAATAIPGIAFGQGLTQGNGTEDLSLILLVNLVCHVRGDEARGNSISSD